MAWIRWSKVEELPVDLWRELQSLPHLGKSQWESIATWPASVTLKNGMEIPCVLFIDKDDRRKQGPGLFRKFYHFNPDVMIDVKSIEKVYPSPYKTPPTVEKKLDDHGETSMGHWAVVLVLKDGTTFWHHSGGILPFISVPQGYSSADVVDVIFPPREAFSSKESYLRTIEKYANHPEQNEPWPVKYCYFKRPVI